MTRRKARLDSDSAMRRLYQALLGRLGSLTRSATARGADAPETGMALSYGSRGENQVVDLDNPLPVAGRREEEIVRLLREIRLELRAVTVQLEELTHAGVTGDDMEDP
jgi:hypothetical protein